VVPVCWTIANLSELPEAHLNNLCRFSSRRNLRPCMRCTIYWWRCTIDWRRCTTYWWRCVIYWWRCAIYWWPCAICWGRCTIKRPCASSAHSQHRVRMRVNDVIPIRMYHAQRCCVRQSSRSASTIEYNKHLRWGQCSDRGGTFTNKA